MLAGKISYEHQDKYWVFSCNDEKYRYTINDNYLLNFCCPMKINWYFPSIMQEVIPYQI